MIPEPDPHQGRGLITSVYIFFLFNKLFIFKDAVEFLYQPKGGKVKCRILKQLWIAKWWEKTKFLFVLHHHH